MPNERKKKLHLIFGCVVGALVITLGIALMLSCWAIYTSGPSPYSPDSIGLRFQKIAFLVYLTFAEVLGGIILSLVLPLEKRRPKAIRDDKVIMEKMKEKAASAVNDLILKEQKRRFYLRISTACAFFALMVYPAIYFFTGNHFTVETQNDDILKAMTLTLIPGIIGLGLCYACSLLTDKSYRRETEQYKLIIAENKGQSNLVANQNARSAHKRLLAIRWCIFVLALVMIFAGIFNGGADDVLLKAIVICTECIGLG